MPANYENRREAHAKGVNILQTIKIMDVPHAALDGACRQMLRGSINLLSVKERAVYGVWMSLVLLLWLTIPNSLACSR